MSNCVHSSSRSGITALSALLLAVLVVPSPAHGATVLAEDFANVAGLSAAGWTLVNNSSAGGSTSWFQGNPGVFPAQDGTDDYVAANFLAAGAGGDISDWLLLPALTVNNGDTLSFVTRGAGAAPDRLEVRFSAGTSANVGTTPSSVGSFTTLLLSINPALAAAYPTAWTSYTVALSGLSGATLGRLAFRYFVTDTATNGDYLGIDTVRVTAVPEPAFVSLVTLGLIGFARRFRKSDSRS